MCLKKEIRVLIADDHNLFRLGLIEILKDDSEISIIGEAADGNELVEKYFALNPDVIVADISMPGASGLKALKKIRERDLSVKALFLSMFTDEIYFEQVCLTGGKGLISKNISLNDLETAIKTVSSGGEYFGKEFSVNDLSGKGFVRPEANPDASGNHKMKLSSLSDREKEVLIYISQGLTSNEIACKMFLSKRTVDKHRTNIMRKLNISSLMELFKYSIKLAEHDGC